MASASAPEAAPAAPAPRRIERLEEAVVNRIAAGEVVHRPCAALKELLENSLDAGSTSITVTAKAGGMKLLQIADDGHGIKHEDLAIVCERFTTSKLRTFDELQQGVPTYGFRGEALASITHVAHVTITTKTADQQCAFKAKYQDGHLVPLGPGQPAEPKRCAGVTGTQITVEDLFYNMPTRRNALKSASEQYHRILDVVIRYAIHNGGKGIAFTCKKFRESSADFSATKSNSIVDNIRAAYGPAVARELSPFEGQSELPTFRFSGVLSGANYSLKKGTFILFINNRLVESSALKRAVEGVYSEYLPKGTHPFVYLAVELPPDSVDVNVHPTKREVHFLNEEALLDAVEEAVKAKLLGANQSRTFYAHSLAGAAAVDEAPEADAEEPAGAEEGEQDEQDEAAKKPKKRKQAQLVEMEKPKAKKPAANPSKLVRTDARAVSLEAYMQPSQPPSQRCDHGGSDHATVAAPVGPRGQRRRVTNVNLRSVLNMRADVDARSHEGMTELLRDHSFVGTVNDARSCVQHRTKLYLVSHVQLARELFYQAALDQWGGLSTIALEPPAGLRDLAAIALDQAESGWTEADGDKTELADEVARLLCSHAPMLREYLGVTIDPEAGTLSTLPILVPGHVPELVALPMFVLRMATEVTWDEEQPCFEGLLSELALFYAKLPVATPQQSGADAGLHPAQGALQHVLFPAMRSGLRAPQQLTQDKSVMEVACLQRLYRIFERC